MRAILAEEHIVITLEDCVAGIDRDGRQRAHIECVNADARQAGRNRQRCHIFATTEAIICNGRHAFAEDEILNLIIKLIISARIGVDGQGLGAIIPNVTRVWCQCPRPNGHDHGEQRHQRPRQVSFSLEIFHFC